ncbi:MAG: HIRAN domain-containing protein [Xanthobacteraceae bacterium]
MGLFSRLFGRQPVESEPKPLWRTSRQQAPIRYVVIGSGDFDFDIVGESRYQDALDRICGGKTDGGHEIEVEAMLIEEPSNSHDANAVKVTIQGHTVGYLARPDAEEYKHHVRYAGHAGQFVRVKAVIVGGWDRGRRGAGHYGVRLDMDMPPKVQAWS